LGGLHSKNKLCKFRVQKFMFSKPKFFLLFPVDIEGVEIRVSFFDKSVGNKKPVGIRNPF